MGFVNLFFRDKFKQFEDFQIRWMTVVSEHRDSDNTDLRMAVQSCKGAGKTTMQAITLIWFVMCFPGAKIRAIASTKTQTIDILLNECKVLITDAKLGAMFDMLQFSIVLKGEGAPNVIRGMVVSDDHPDRAAGDHADFNLYVVDEASTLGRKVYNSICGIFATGKSYLILSGNPTDLTGESVFYEACTSNQVLRSEEQSLSIEDVDRERRKKGVWVTMKVGSADLKRASYHSASLNKIYPPGTIENEMYVKANFPLFTKTNFVQQPILQAATDVRRRQHSRDLESLTSNVVIGVDVSYGAGKDYTCAVARCNNQAKILHYSNMTSLEDVGMLIMRWKENGARVVLDCNGVGRGILMWLQERGQQVVDVSLNRAPTGALLFTNHKSELLWNTKEWLNNYDPYIHFIDGNMEDKFIKEGLYMSFYSKDAKYDIGNKKYMSFSPDIFDALSFTFFYGKLTIKRESIMMFNPGQLVL